MFIYCRDGRNSPRLPLLSSTCEFHSWKTGGKLVQWEKNVSCSWRQKSIHMLRTRIKRNSISSDGFGLYQTVWLPGYFFFSCAYISVRLSGRVQRQLLELSCKRWPADLFLGLRLSSAGLSLPSESQIFAWPWRLPCVGWGWRLTCVPGFMRWKFDTIYKGFSGWRTLWLRNFS